MISCQECIEVVKDVPQERVSERTETSSQDRPLQHTVDPTQIMEGKFEVNKIVFLERILENDCAQIEVPREREQQLTAEQIGDVPQFRKETVEEVLVPREPVQQGDCREKKVMFLNCGMGGRLYRSGLSKHPQEIAPIGNRISYYCT